MKDWDNLRVFLATARAGSTHAAAKELGINQSTISRRVRQLEERSATRLFDRRGRGLVLTDAGEELRGLASEIEERVAAVDRRLQGRDVSLAGSVRLSMPDLMVRPTAGHLARFSALHPNIEIEVVVDNGVVSLTHRKADLVLRVAKSPPDQLIGRRIAPAWAAIYGSIAYTQDRAGPLDPSALDWVRWEDSWRFIPMEQWIDVHVAPAQVRARVNTSLAHGELIAAGIGVGFQLCYTGDADDRLRRAAPPVDFGLVLWLLTHRDLKHTARIRALMAFLGDALAADRALFDGSNYP